MDSKTDLLKKRDEKIIPHLKQYAPVWIVAETIIEEESAVQFNAIFHHSHHGWVKRRYRFDGFNAVLYHKGQTRIGSDEISALEEKEPYINATVANIPNAYGG